MSMTASEMGRRSAASRLARIRATVDSRYPHLEEDDRETIAYDKYRDELALQGRLGAKAANRNT